MDYWVAEFETTGNAEFFSAVGGVFSTRAKAQAYIRARGSYDLVENGAYHVYQWRLTRMTLDEPKKASKT